MALLTIYFEIAKFNKLFANVIFTDK